MEYPAHVHISRFGQDQGHSSKKACQCILFKGGLHLVERQSCVIFCVSMPRIVSIVEHDSTSKSGQGHSLKSNAKDQRLNSFKAKATSKNSTPKFMAGLMTSFELKDMEGQKIKAKDHIPAVHIVINNLPLCSPRKTSLNFRRGFPNSGPFVVIAG